MITFIGLMDLAEKEYNEMFKDFMIEHDMMRAELDIMLFLVNYPQFNTAQEIVDKRRIVKSHASLAIKDLIAKGLLTKDRSEEDHRAFLLSLTEKGKEIGAIAKEKQSFFVNELFKGMKSREVATIIEYMYTMRGNLEHLDKE